MPTAQTGFAIYQVPLSRTLIFSASGLYRFCSSAFPESLLLNRKSLPGNFRLEMQISRRRPAFKNPNGIFETPLAYRQGEQGLPAAADFTQRFSRLITNELESYSGALSFL